jgi:hypothetical protein
MKFIQKLEKLKTQYATNCVIRKNGTLLLSPGKIPRCKHMLFAPILERRLAQNLKDYKGNFPSEFSEFLRYSNGAELFSIKVVMKSGNEIAYSLFSILGFPSTPPYARPQDQEECFSVRIEDHARHSKIPKQWLKCGIYAKDYDFRNQYDIFLDTETGKVYSVIKNQCEVIEQWESLDECFCAVYDSFADAKESYPYR